MSDDVSAITLHYVFNAVATVTNSLWHSAVTTLWQLHTLIPAQTWYLYSGKPHPSTHQTPDSDSGYLEATGKARKVDIFEFSILYYQAFTRWRHSEW